MKRFFEAVAFGIVLAIACGGGSSPTASRAGEVVSTIPNGPWGGVHVSLIAADTGATLAFDCAHGSITPPLSVGADGRFRLPGTFVREHGGPIGIGEPEDSQPASYSGAIQGSKMTLSIELTRDQLTVGPFALEFQSPAQIVKCL